MTPNEREQLHILCQRIAVEQSTEKFKEYVAKLEDLIRQKAGRLEMRDKNPEPGARWT